MTDVAGVSLGALSALSELTQAFFSGRVAWKEAGEFEKTASLFLLRYSVEQARLNHWCDRAGFELQTTDGVRSFVAVAPSHQQIRERFVKPFAQEIVGLALTEITILLDDIRKKINLIKVQPQGQELGAVEMVNLIPQINPNISANERIAEIHRQRYQEIVNRMSRTPLASARKKSLQIATAVSTSIKELGKDLDQLRTQNDRLESFLNEEQTDAVNDVLTSLMLAGVIDHNHLASIIDMPTPGLPYLLILAEDRYWSLEVQRSITGSLPAMPFNFSNATQFGLGSGLAGGRKRCQAVVRGKNCIIEWNRPVGIHSSDDVQRVQEMISRLVQMLYLEHPQSYRVLRSQKFVLEDDSEVRAAAGKRWFGIAFEFPSFADTRMAPVSLEELMDQISPPPLGDVFELARKLARCLLTFHTCGWLHQSLNSRNIIFFTDKENPNRGVDLHRPYIVGFEYTRGVADISEGRDEAAIEILQKDPYQHPMRRAHHPTNNKVPYRQEFDIYSLGRILCDLAGWKPVEKAMKESAEATAKEQNAPIQPLTLEDWIEDYPGNIGEIYTNVIRWCLGFTDGRIKTPSERGGLVEGQQLAYEYHDRVIRQLVKCRA